MVTSQRTSLDSATVARTVAIIIGSNRNAIARQTDVNPTHIGRIFKGTRTPSLGLAHKIASYLNLSLDAFYAGIQEIKNDATLTL